MTEKPVTPDDEAAREEAVASDDDAARHEEETVAEDGATQAATPPASTAEQRPRRRRKRRAAAQEEAAEAEIEPTAEDIEAQEAAEDVVLEAEAEAEEPEEEEPKPGRRRRAAAPEEEPPKPAPTRRRRPQRDPSLPPPVVRAQAKYVRSSARKARLVCNHIRGKSVEEARAILALTPRATARDWSKLLESAVANAEHNHELVGEDLYVKAVHADDGPTIKRFRPRAMGRATRIRKRTSHLTILLTPKD
jgi:ribosomal protein L22